MGAVLLLSAQALALVHSHQNFLTQDLKAQAELSSGIGLCAVCLLAFHSPLNPAAAPALTRPRVAIQSRITLTPCSRCRFNLSSSPTRAPPLTI